MDHEKKINELEAELKLAKSATDTAKSEAKAATEKAARLERELEASQKSLAETQAQRDAEKARAEELSKKLETAEQELGETKASLESLKKSAEEIEAKLIEAEVDALVGKKIDPSEKEEFVELRKTNRDLFNKMVAKRKEKRLGERVVSEETPGTTAKKPSSRLVERLNGASN